MTAVLVTGGAGFIGSYVTRALLSLGYRVVVYDTRPDRNALDLVLSPRQSADLLVERGEVTDGWRLLRVCRDHDIELAVHLASPLTQDVTENPMAGIRDVCLGTATMFEVAREAALRRVVWASSVAVFGPRTTYPPGPLPNDACHRPVSLYGSCKSLCEDLARRAFAVDRVDTVGLRLSVVYGAGRLRGYMSYPSHVIRRVASGEPAIIEFGRQRLHWQYVEEVADMTTCALRSPRPGEGRSYNTSGDVRTWAEAAAALGRIRSDVPIDVADGLDPMLADVVDEYDDSEFRARYHYEPSWPLERGVAATVQTYQRILGEGSMTA
jgi:UDP-glucose 4-epimerase